VTAVQFQPWVGARYGPRSRWGLSVLILGESHYDQGYNRGDALTSYVIEEHVARRGPGRPVFTKLERTFDADCTKTTGREAFWESVSFYNYVQEFAGDAARQRPDQRQFRASWAPFVSVLQRLQPDVVVAVGFDLWRSLEPLLPSRAPMLLSEGRAADYAVLPDAAPGAGVISRIRHPATSYRYEDWRPVVSSMLVVARALHGFPEIGEHARRDPNSG
jgi:hypothetical protein